MPVTDVSHDLDNLTLTIQADFAAPVQRIWEVYADPRQLERVWGPPTYPATFVDHSLTPGGRMNYFMTSPEGDKFGGYWEITSVDQPDGFAFDDGFAHVDAENTFTKNTDMPVSANVFTFEPTETGTRATYVGTYQSAEALQQVLDMGMVEGASSAIGQIDELVAADA